MSSEGKKNDVFIAAKMKKKEAIVELHSCQQNIVKLLYVTFDAEKRLNSTGNSIEDRRLRLKKKKTTPQ